MPEWPGDIQPRTSFLSSHESLDRLFIEDLLGDVDRCPDGMTYSHSFISEHFKPIKLSHNDLMSLSQDFSDQTLGGHRVYREETICGQAAKTYQYLVKVIKFCGKGHSAHGSRLMVENNLLAPSKEFLELLKPAQPQRRGRPRKYPVGFEPYKFRKRVKTSPEPCSDTSNRVLDQITETRKFEMSLDSCEIGQYPSSEETVEPDIREEFTEHMHHDENSREDPEDRWRAQIFRELFNAGL